MAELFNGTEVSALPGDEFIAANKPGIAGSKIISVANFIAQITGNAPLNNSFQNADLDSGNDYQLIITHGRNTLYVTPTLFDNKGVQQSTEGIFVVIDSNSVKFVLNAPIDGIWRYSLQFN